jgi:hypothetical protein
VPLTEVINEFSTIMDSVNTSDTTVVVKTVLDSLGYSAEKIIYNLKTDQIKLVKNAEIYYKKSFIKSDSILIDLKDKIAISEGKSELFDGEESIYGSSIFYDIDSEEGMLLSGNTEFEGGFYSGKRMRKVGERTFDIDDARYTTCNLIEEHYYIYSPRFRVFLNDKIVARPVILFVNHFPIFALPFATFPIKRERHSGFLIPDPGYNKTEGKTLKDLAYFQILGDYGDILLAMDFMELTGLEFRLRSRYLKRYILQGNVNSRFLYYHQESLDKYKIRWTINTYHKQTISPYSNLLIRTDFVSDAEVRKTSENKEVRMDKTLHSYLYYIQRRAKNDFNTTIDYKQNLIDSNRTLYSKLYFSKKAGYHNFNIYGDFRYYNDYRSSSSVTNKDKISLNLPSANFTMFQRHISQFFDKEKEDFTDWWDNFYLSYTGNLLHRVEVNKKSPSFSELLYHDTYDLSGNIVTQHREGVKHSISLRYDRQNKKILGFLSFLQSFNYKEIWADKDKKNNKLVRGYFYNTSTTVSAPIYGIFTLNTGRLRAMRHIINPKISFGWNPDFSKNDIFYSFSPIIISKAEKSERLSFSLDNKLQAKILDKSNKIRKLNNLFYMNSFLSYDFEKKPKGFSDLSHKISVMPFSVGIGKTNMKLSNSFNCKQDFYSLEIENYSINSTFSLNGNLSYVDYFPYKELKQVQDRFSSQGKDTLDIGIEKPEESQKPWSISMSCAFTKNKKTGYYSSGLHTSSRFNLTKNWNIDYNSYYNFKEHKLISQGINIYRNLHCWQLRFTWSKSGDYWSYRFQINAKKLPDLKFRHSDRKHW